MILYNYFNNNHIINNINIENIENINNSNIKNVNNLNLENININDNYNVCFIISCKYNRNYINFIKYCIDNIIKYYTNYLIIIVDNNSIYINDLISLFNLLNYKNIIILINSNECKFEIGAYNFGIVYLIQNNLIDKYDYFIFTQDNFVLKNKYDFNIFKNNNIFAAGINGGYFPYPKDPTLVNVILHNTYNILKEINLFNNLDKIIEECFCVCFI